MTVARRQVVKKWGLTPSRLVQHSARRNQARRLSPFFHCLKVATLTCVILAVAAGQPAAAEVGRILREMEAEGAHFDPLPLLQLGRPGLSAVLDQLLPDTAGPKAPKPAEAPIDSLIEQLGSENYRVREAATEKLIERGPTIGPTLHEAAKSLDAEISWRATRILRRWEAAQRDEHGPQVAAMTVYLQRLDDAACLEELAKRTRAALSRGMPQGARHELLWQCLMVIARSHRPEFASALAPLLENGPSDVAVLVIERLGSVSDSGFYPSLMRDALESPRSEIAAAAVKAVPHCPAYAGREEVERRLIGLFQGQNETLKLLACYPLMRDFQYPPAVDFLLNQLGSDDPQRRARAFAWLGDPSVLGRPVTPRLLQTLGPLLQSADDNTRRQAASALAMYSGEEVVRRLVPLLDDPKAMIAEEVSYRLMHQRDKVMLARLLAAAAREHPDEKIRKKAASVLERLAEEPSTARKPRSR